MSHTSFCCVYTRCMHYMIIYTHTYIYIHIYIERALYQVSVCCSALHCIAVHCSVHGMSWMRTGWVYIWFVSLSIYTQLNAHGMSIHIMCVVVYIHTTECTRHEYTYNVCRCVYTHNWMHTGWVYIWLVSLCILDRRIICLTQLHDTTHSYCTYQSVVYTRYTHHMSLL